MKQNQTCSFRNYLFKIFPNQNASWFNTKIPHGSETNGYGVSLRVDGEFTSELRKRLFGKDSKWETITSYEK